VLAREGDPGTVDAAYLDEVAHHIEPPSRAFEDCARFVRPGGDLFLLEPNFTSPVVQAYFFKVRGFRTVTEQLDERTGVWEPYGNEHIRPLPRWKRIARDAGFEPVEETWLVPFGLKDATRVSRLRKLAEKAPLVRNLLATHVTCRFRRVQSIR
jgi:SAM-dependent methyltransferase